MKVWGIGQVSDQEKKDILEKHRSLYDGYRTLQPQYASEQPLTVWDSAGDKAGITVNNRGEVKPYTNMGINESVESQELDEANMCECGGMMYEGECNECGWKMEEIDEETPQVKALKNVQDLNLSDKFDYVESEIDEISISDLEKGKKYKFNHPVDSDEIEFDDEYGDEEDKVYKFKGKQYHAIPKKGVESFIDFLDEDSALDADAMQSVTGQEAPHMADDMAPDGMDDDSDNDRKMMADGEMEEQGGNADDMDVDDVASAYNFVSGGPMAGSDFPNYSEDESGEVDFEDSTDEIDEDSFTDLIDADNDLETDREELEEEDPNYEYMESAWADDEVDEQMGLYSEKDPPHHFKSGGPQQFKGPLAKITDSEIEEQGEDEDVYWEKDLADDELDLDISKFNPEDSSWEEIKAHTGNWDEIDEDLRESFVTQKQKIMEMMNRMKVL
jgi:hypothetical protein